MSQIFNSDVIASSTNYPKTKCEFCNIILKSDLDVSKHIFGSSTHKMNVEKFISTQDLQNKNNDKNLPKNLASVFKNSIRIRSIEDIKDLADKGYFDIKAGDDETANIANTLAKVILKSIVEFESKAFPEHRDFIMSAFSTDDGREHVGDTNTDTVEANDLDENTSTKSAKVHTKENNSNISNGAESSEQVNIDQKPTVQEDLDELYNYDQVSSTPESTPPATPPATPSPPHSPAARRIKSDPERNEISEPVTLGNTSLENTSSRTMSMDSLPASTVSSNSVSSTSTVSTVKPVPKPNSTHVPKISFWPGVRIKQEPKED